MRFLSTILSHLFMLSTCLCDCSTGAKFKIYISNFNNSVSFPISNASGMLSYINPDLQTIVYAFGANGSATGPQVKDFITTIIGLEEYNVVLVDWSEEARTTELGTALSYALINSPGVEAVGCQVGVTIADLVQKGLNGSSIHLIGHSLGAHLMGKAGTCAQQAGFTIPHITGLDPAGPLFSGIISFPHLDKTCASFVEIIHTDPGHYGTAESTGHADIFANYGDDVQPDCPPRKSLVMDKDDMCSHIRSIYLLLAGFIYPDILPALRATNYDDFVSLDGYGTDITWIGKDTNFDARGNYYLTTTGEFPYGKKEEGLKSESSD